MCEVLEVVLDDLCCAFGKDSHPKTSGFWVLLAADFLQLLSVVNSHRWVAGKDKDGRYVIVCVLDALSFVSGLK